MNRERSIIERLQRPTGPSVALGIGDDSAMLATPGIDRLLICHDTLNAGTHFLEDDPPESVGHRCLAVNISDIAAMGGKPRWASLSLSLPSVSGDWVNGFASGFHAIADHHGVELVGGDTTRGPLSVSLCLLGEPSAEGVLMRAKASPGDLVCVTGSLGAAAHALAHPGGSTQSRLWYPQPRVALGQALAGVATSALDLSDGLLTDLPRLLGDLGATIVVDDIPTRELDPLSLDANTRLQFAINGGDDYELCFTIPRRKRDALPGLADAANIEISIIGEVTAGDDVRYRNTDGSLFDVRRAAYDHFPD